MQATYFPTQDEPPRGSASFPGMAWDLTGVSAQLEVPEGSGTNLMHAVGIDSTPGIVSKTPNRSDVSKNFCQSGQLGHQVHAALTPQLIASFPPPLLEKPFYSSKPTPTEYAIPVVPKKVQSPGIAPAYHPVVAEPLREPSLPVSVVERHDTSSPELIGYPRFWVLALICAGCIPPPMLIPGFMIGAVVCCIGSIVFLAFQRNPNDTRHPSRRLPLLVSLKSLAFIACHLAIAFDILMVLRAVTVTNPLILLGITALGTGASMMTVPNGLRFISALLSREIGRSRVFLRISSVILTLEMLIFIAFVLQTPAQSGMIPHSSLHAILPKLAELIEGEIIQIFLAVQSAIVSGMVSWCITRYSLRKH